MALLLAPYNEAMRIGMGFNSYTQQLCVNDIVRKPGGKRASESDLRATDPTDGQIASTNDRSDMLSKDSQGSFHKTNTEGGQADVSQVVSWDAGFVNNLSDVTNSLNISGALSITCAAFGGGGANAHFIDSTQFIKSDARYSIQVKVTNQKLVANDVTEFTPIPNVPPSKFNEVYGDCFISGFIEGGVLSALVLKSLVDEESLMNIGGGINIEMNLKVVNVKGSASGDKVDETKKKVEQTTITISWSGGGDIKPDNIKNWDVATLTQVAMEFPDKVAICPQRTYAILTKYTSLRSFHEQTVKGSPLDYEIAGIYTSSLLDAYMEYKAMWEDLNKTSKEIDKGTSIVKRREAGEKLMAYRELVKRDYTKRMEKYNEYKAALVRAPEYGNQIKLEQPLPANAIDPYAADAFGIDEASRDCRFEMIKIVREVNEVTADPKVAIDPDRNWRYLSPHVFRLLLPTDKERTLSPEEIAKLQTDLAAKIQECAMQEKEKIEAQRERDVLKTDKESLQQQVTGQEQKSASSAEQQSASVVREKQLRETLESTKAEKDRSDKQMADLQRRMEEVQNQLRTAQETAERNRREREALFNEFNSGPEIAIHNITWGPRDLLGDSNIVNRVIDYIRNGRNIPFTNDFFGCDPQFGVVKRGRIVYNKRGKPVVTLEEREGGSRAIV